MNFSDYARQVSLSRPLRTVTCQHCGTPFQARDPRAKYHNNRCRSAARYARVKAKKVVERLDTVAAFDYTVSTVNQPEQQR